MREIIFAIIVMSLAAFAGCQSESNPTSSSETDSDNPSDHFQLSNADSFPFPVVSDFAELAPLFDQKNDTIYVINFWATWCGPCVEELPYFEQLAEEVADKPVKFAMISLDFKRNLKSKLLKFIEERPFTMPVIALIDHRSNIWIDQVEPDWSGAIPITIVYQNDKRVFIEDQFESYDDLREIVQQYLNE